MKNDKRIFQYTAAFVSAALLMSRNSMTSQAASTYARVSDGVYQLADGTRVSGVCARGIDLSHWQGSVDWKKAAKDDVKFAMLGTRYNGAVDPFFHEFAAGASAAGIELGAYIYSYAMTAEEAEAEADFVLKLIKDYPISYPVAFDMEDSRQGKLSKSQLADMANVFCKKIAAAGYYPIIYANDNWLANKLDMSLMNYDVWVARYEVPHDYEDPVMWQATSKGYVDGVSGYCDIDFQYQDFSDKIQANTWRTIDGKTYYYQNHQMKKDSWIHDGTGWFYMNAAGHPLTGWYTENGKTYYLDQNTGRMAEGWQKSEKGWMYFGTSGALKMGWIHDGGTWYFADSEGVMQTGWLKDAGEDYYLRPSGAMAVGWKELDNSWYYFESSGAMAKGWAGSDESGWYYLDPGTGKMYASTQMTIDNVEYRIDENGLCTVVVPETEKNEIIEPFPG